MSKVDKYTWSTMKGNSFKFSTVAGDFLKSLCITHQNYILSCYLPACEVHRKVRFEINMDESMQLRCRLLKLRVNYLVQVQ